MTVYRAERLGDGAVPIWAVWHHCLTRIKMELGAIEMSRDDVRPERHSVLDMRPTSG